MASKSGSSGRGTSGSGAGRPRRAFVSPDEGGGYRVTRPGAKRASVIEPTKAKAEQRAKEIIRRAGGGEVPFKDNRGRITDSDTVKPGNDPFPPRDKKH